jgi:hypothetical protein
MELKLSNMINKLLCRLFGHKWRISWIHGASAIGKCRRCGEYKHALINEFL